MKNQDPRSRWTRPSRSRSFDLLAGGAAIKTNKNLESLLQRTALSEADAVIGRTVTSADGKDQLASSRR